MFFSYSNWVLLSASWFFLLDVSWFLYYVGKSACHQTREIIAEFNDISQNLQQLSASYKHGKLIYGQAKKSIIKDLQNSHSEITRMSNEYKYIVINKSFFVMLTCKCCFFPSMIFFIWLSATNLILSLVSFHFPVNKTNLYQAEKRDMLFWYKFTKEGKLLNSN